MTKEVEGKELEKKIMKLCKKKTEKEIIVVCGRIHRTLLEKRKRRLKIDKLQKELDQLEKKK